MGFLKRFFSIGGKRNKNKRSEQDQFRPTPEPRLRPIQEDEQEAAVSRLLRSSSARYAVVAELDYASLPPLPHPINNVIQTPAASTASLSSTNTTQRGTYTVTVHRRKHHAHTDFPNANRDSDDSSTTPQQRYCSSGRETSQIIQLRSDPSVANLVNMYDDHGSLPSRAFSNSPPSDCPLVEGRAQTRRNGSTLRQLLGSPSLNSRADASSLEGDISWAERFLGETDSLSSTSSLALRTPNDPSSHFPHDLQTNSHHDHTFSTDHDLSSNASENPAISSMEVELSNFGDESSSIRNPPYQKNNPYEDPDPSTPQRASQVFGFLTEKRRSKAPFPDDWERPLPSLPSTFSSPSSEGSHHLAFHSRFSSDSTSQSYVSTHAIPIPHSDDTHRIYPSDLNSTYQFPLPNPATPRAPQHQQLSSRFSCSTRSRSPSLSSSNNHSSHSNAFSVPESDHPIHPHRSVDTLHEGTQSQSHKVRVIMTGPTKVIVTAPTPSANDTLPPSRIPRGPRARAQSKKRANIETDEPIIPLVESIDRPTFGERSNSDSTDSTTSRDPFTPVPQRKKHHQRRSVSQSSLLSFDAEPVPVTARAAERSNRSRRDGGGQWPIMSEFEKENQLLSAATASSSSLSKSNAPDLPITPTPVRSSNSDSDGNSTVNSNSNDQNKNIANAYSRSLFRSAVNPDRTGHGGGLFRPPVGMTPSPASSSELSPVGQQLMVNLRQQRMKAREEERRKGSRLGTTRYTVDVRG